MVVLRVALTGEPYYKGLAVKGLGSAHVMLRLRICVCW